MFARVAQLIGVATAAVAFAVVLLLFLRNPEEAGRHQSGAVLQMLLGVSAAAVVAAALRKPAVMIILSIVLIFPFGLYFLGSPAFPMYFGLASFAYALAAMALAFHSGRSSCV